MTSVCSAQTISYLLNVKDMNTTQQNTIKNYGNKTIADAKGQPFKTTDTYLSPNNTNYVLITITPTAAQKTALDTYIFSGKLKIINIIDLVLDKHGETIIDIKQVNPLPADFYPADPLNKKEVK